MAITPNLPEASEAQRIYCLTRQSLEHYIADMHQRWFSSVDPQILKGHPPPPPPRPPRPPPPERCVAGLERTLFVKDGDKGCLAVNFDADVLDMLQEVQFWEWMRLTGPYVAIEVNAQRQKLKLLRETALAIVRDYNNVRPIVRRPRHYTLCRADHERAKRPREAPVS